MQTLDTDVAVAPAAPADTGDAQTATTDVDLTVRIDGELAQRMLRSARWSQ